MLITLLFYAKNYQRSRRPRSPFFFIKAFNTTGSKIYWDEFQQPSRHLIGAEIGVFRGDNAEKIINFLDLKKIYLVDPWKEYINKDTGEIEDFAPSVMQRLLSSMSGGMAVALYTTIAGLVTSTLLKLQFHVVETSSADLVTRLQVFVDTQPQDHRYGAKGINADAS